MLTPVQQHSAIQGPCFALGFLVDSDNRQNARNQLKGFPDAAIFHRWMSLTWTLVDAEAIGLLTDEEAKLLAEFNTVYDSIPWVPITSHPFISDTSERELDRLRPVASKLLELLRTRKQVTAMRCPTAL